MSLPDWHEDEEPAPRGGREWMLAVAAALAIGVIVVAVLLGVGYCQGLN